MRVLIVALMTCALPVAAMAQSKIEGVWATPEACHALFQVQSGRNSFPKGYDSFIYLRNDGMTGWEWGCDFMTRHTNEYGQTVSVSICGGEGESWPSLFLLEHDKSAGWRVIGLPDLEQKNTLEFPVKCNGVK